MKCRIWARAPLAQPTIFFFWKIQNEIRSGADIFEKVKQKDAHEREFILCLPHLISGAKSPGFLG